MIKFDRVSQEERPLEGLKWACLKSGSISIGEVTSGRGRVAAKCQMKRNILLVAKPSSKYFLLKIEEEEKVSVCVCERERERERRERDGSDGFELNF